MDSKEDIRPISYVKAHAPDVLNRVRETQRPLYITQNGEAKAVLLDTESYERMTKALGMLKLLTQGEQDVQKGRMQDQDEFFAEMDEYLKKENSHG
ncbi:MAG: type II toxin-antitoxin system Phd/YefM family antitoxin [Limnochordia bacterium]|nr:type II toxin-antitoxin system Phd/YefM family antitoxin [Limnochordia bacterium]